MTFMCIRLSHLQTTHEQSVLRGLEHIHCQAIVPKIVGVAFRAHMMQRWVGTSDRVDA